MSTSISQIQTEFLLFEVDYKRNQSIFVNLKKLAKDVSISKLERVNSQTYEIAETLLSISQEYLQIQLKLNNTDADSKLSELIKSDMLKSIESNNRILAQVEVKLKELLDLIVGRDTLFKGKRVSISDFASEDTSGPFFVSKYEKVLEKRLFNPKALSAYVVPFLISITIFTLAISGSINSFAQWLFSSVGGSISGSSTETTESISDVFSSPSLGPSFEVLHSMFSTMVTIASTIIVMISFMMVMGIVFKSILSIIYVALPKNVAIPILTRIINLDSLELDSGERYVVVEKFNLYRAKEILVKLRQSSAYRDSEVVNVLHSNLKDKSVDSVLSLEDNYSILLTEELYKIINSQKYGSDIVISSLSRGTDSRFRDKTHLNIQLLKMRLGLN
ncbi:hypothetical protein [Paenibacillus pabuli]|uniref:hypothetical protein n=1 Tax=Paenibacillus pabuli TaxID=1472 RepID=UPI003241CAD6